MTTLKTVLRDIAATRVPDAPPALKSRWKCPACGSENVQISLPTWYREMVPVGYENPPSDLAFVETDEGADISWWHCEDCDETDGGQPEENT